MKRKGLLVDLKSIFWFCSSQKSTIKAMFNVRRVCVKFVIVHSMVLTKAPAERICWKENRFHCERESALIMWFNCFHLQSNIQCARKEKTLITKQTIILCLCWHFPLYLAKINRSDWIYKIIFVWTYIIKFSDVNWRQQYRFANLERNKHVFLFSCKRTFVLKTMLVKPDGSSTHFISKVRSMAHANEK